jgi:hypothetical protein
VDLAPRAHPEQGIGRGQNTENNHETSQKKSRHAQAPMKIHAACGRQRSLRDEQQNPAGKHRAVYLNDPAG